MNEQLLDNPKVGEILNYQQLFSVEKRSRNEQLKNDRE